MSGTTDIFAVLKDPAAVTALGQAAGHQNMQQLIQLRWIAVVGQISTIVIVAWGLGIQLPVAYMLEVLACLIAFNVASQLRWHEKWTVTNGELFLSMLVDVASLTVQLYLSGGTSNPFVFLYLLQVILSAVLLEAWSTWTIVAITCGCLAGLALVSKPLTLPLYHERGYFSLYIQGMLICFAINASLLVVFITRIMTNLRSRDSKLAEMRQRAAEEEHIVRMGLLASGAAHELGTPLATLSVILGDWKRMPAFKNDPDMLEELQEMQTQLARCKAIVSGILLSAGEARGESSTKTTINTFLDELVAEWRGSRPVQTFEYENHLVQDVPVAFDSTLKQTICNLLDNALEASPHFVRFDVSREGDALKMLVTDRGPGFKPAVLEQLGKPYNSTKDKPGHGLGLFLVVNVARTLGGTVDASNLVQGGAAVLLTLPLAAIAVPDEEEEKYDH
jgi:two-component system, sensor histidine kinase RegB